MSTKPGIPDHFSIHDVRDAAAGSPPAGGGTATRAQLHALRNLSIPFDLDHPPTFDDAARLIREAEEAENPMRVVMGPPVRDIREAMHPAGIISHEPPFARPAEPGDAPIAGALIEGAFPWIDPETIGFDPEIAKTIERAAHPLQTLLGGPHVATLPDGSRVNLPAGTVLREGEGPPPPVRFFDLANSLRAAFARVEEAVPEPAAPMDLAEVEQLIRAWDALKAEMVAQEKINAPVRVVAPPSTIEHARDLLRRAQAWIAPGVPDIARPGTEAQPAATIGQLRAEIAAFLAGAAQPEGSR